MIFLNSASSAAALVFYLSGVCTQTDTEGKQSPEYLKILRKNTIFNEHPVYSNFKGFHDHNCLILEGLRLRPKTIIFFTSPITEPLSLLREHMLGFVKNIFFFSFCLDNVTKTIGRLLDGYDIRLRPNFGGKCIFRCVASV